MLHFSSEERNCHITKLVADGVIDAIRHKKKNKQTKSKKRRRKVQITDSLILM